MEKLIFSQAGVYRLQKLAYRVHQITGIRHKLSSHDSIIELLQKATALEDLEISDLLLAFSELLDDSQLDALIAEGVRVRTLN